VPLDYNVARPRRTQKLPLPAKTSALVDEATAPADEEGIRRPVGQSGPGVVETITIEADGGGFVGWPWDGLGYEGLLRREFDHDRQGGIGCFVGQGDRV
jgi:hypothetical protein